MGVPVPSRYGGASRDSGSSVSLTAWPERDALYFACHVGRINTIYIEFRPTEMAMDTPLTADMISGGDLTGDSLTGNTAGSHPVPLPPTDAATPR